MYNEKFIPKEKTTYLDQWREHYFQTYQRKCYICGKDFDMFPTQEGNWSYKTRYNYQTYIFCSWTCKCTFDKGKGIYNTYKKSKYK